ncbi:MULTISPECIES: DUF6388 family protein [Acinetobacter]|uniref:DUF6388 family protein n=1 Tax=Acinetobacter TaxID=469 RepID=UPI000F66087A|nr:MULTISPECIES: DUF6388 family protein [Acinetobacter]MCE6119523.1 hypothetical protein [Acinetobacter baumannii]MCE6138100.1 hypothetical protein [Acinetobacter baumannii]MCG9241648.1 DUF6388 family protein [Acinetobacter baumannii]MCH7378966.1 DUF6388 family protein [Acinetobacter higginsii]MDH1004163.1 DUF6388 family protein [Acinetobacter junii]
MNNGKTEKRLAYEKQIKEVLQKAHEQFAQNKNVKAQLDILNPNIAEAIGITFEQYKHQTLLELFVKQAKSLNKDSIDYAIEITLPADEAKTLKELRNQILIESIQ